MESDAGVMTLRVAESKTRDVGRGIARVDPGDLEAAGIETGDVVEIRGGRTTVARIMPAYPMDRGGGGMRVDGLIRGNARVSLDEKVAVKKTACEEAERIELASPLQPAVSGRERDARYIGSLLEGLAVVEGDTVRANLFGTRNRDFVVADTVPKGPVRITSQTRVTMRGKGEQQGVLVSYEDVGGLGKQSQRVREMVELPLKYPQVFERLGIDPPKGVLLYGPPGCGKTLIARAVANETSAYFTHITGPEIMGKYYGESEARLRSVFKEARSNAPAIIFIDEIDAIAPKREDMGGEKQVERRVVAQLLALMDGLDARGEIIVIGATNLPNALDPALRRPGRFDRELELPIPDQTGRLEILNIHTRGLPLAADVQLETLAGRTHGFVGADLESLCREAAMNALRILLESIDFQWAEIPYETLAELEVTMDDFRRAMKEVEPSAIREVFVDIPAVNWSDVGGLRRVKERLVEMVEWPLTYPDLFAQAGVTAPKGLLFSGPPGTGKTLIARALAHESQVNFISIKGPELMTKYIGESERQVREIFRKARQASPCIVFFDEFDALVPPRGSGGGDAQVVGRMISQFLTELDGLEDRAGVLVVAATNRKDLIDPAILRPGRFDAVVEFPLPDREARREIFDVHTRRKPVDGDVALEALALKSEGMTGADIAAVCGEAAMAAIREHLRGRESGVLRVSSRHFAGALEWLQQDAREWRAAATREQPENDLA